jgi:hypothetical protein
VDVSDGQGAIGILPSLAKKEEESDIVTQNETGWLARSSILEPSTTSCGLVMVTDV